MYYLILVFLYLTSLIGCISLAVYFGGPAWAGAGLLLWIPLGYMFAYVCHQAGKNAKLAELDEERRHSGYGV